MALLLPLALLLLLLLGLSFPRLLPGQLCSPSLLHIHLFRPCPLLPAAHRASLRAQRRRQLLLPLPLACCPLLTRQGRRLHQRQQQPAAEDVQLSLCSGAGAQQRPPLVAGRPGPPAARRLAQLLPHRRHQLCKWRVVGGGWWVIGYFGGGLLSFWDYGLSKCHVGPLAVQLGGGQAGA